MSRGFTDRLLSHAHRHSPTAHDAAFRHGDIEDALAELIKKSGGFLGRGTKFGGLDIK